MKKNFFSSLFKPFGKKRTDVNESLSNDENSSSQDDEILSTGKSFPLQNEKLPSTDNQPPTTPTEGLAYELSDDGTYYIVSGMGEATDSFIVIPSTYNNLPVTAIGFTAFRDCKNLVSVTIPDSVTFIDHAAFSGCWHLAFVVIPKSVTSIANCAFV